MTYTIEVTEDDIRQGRRGDCSWCPIALAARRVFLGPVDVSVVWGEMGVNDVDFELPRTANRFIDDFDAGNPVQPFRFEVNA